MPGINLSQSAAQRVESKDSMPFGRGFISLIVILFLTILGWVGVVVFDRKLTGEIEGVSTQIELVRGELSIGSTSDDIVAKIADFQHRVDTIGEELSSRQRPEELLRPFENAMVPGVVLTRYVFDEEDLAVNIEGISDNMNLLAQEMVLLKKSPLVSNVSIGDVTREKDGRMKFSAAVFLQSIEK